MLDEENWINNIPKSLTELFELFDQCIFEDFTKMNDCFSRFKKTKDFEKVEKLFK